jgi:hypothetical protein
MHWQTDPFASKPAPPQQPLVCRDLLHSLCLEAAAVGAGAEAVGACLEGAEGAGAGEACLPALTGTSWLIGCSGLLLTLSLLGVWGAGEGLLGVVGAVVGVALSLVPVGFWLLSAGLLVGSAGLSVLGSLTGIAGLSAGLASDESVSGHRSYLPLTWASISTYAEAVTLQQQK